MGVPALFRWLSKKYPKIVSRVIEETPTKVRNSDDEIIEVPVQYGNKNPNGFEVDNLYLDMNGIVHPCTHPEGRPAPETEEEMMAEVFKYTERVVNMARPRKVLMMAIDGVAPRAKMNQQRSRRFRAAQEAADKEEERQESIRLFEAMGHPVSDVTRNQKSWDSNAITPGTPFMDLLSISLKYWISHKLSTEPSWRDLKVILSDSSVPGEGEHKIVDWIRRQRSYPDWDPNTTHAMYGLDADLIMLSLATHEPHFRVLREDVFFQGDKGRGKCRNCGAEDHFSANCRSEKKMADPNVVEVAKPVDPKPFIWLDVSCLREYLAVELVIPGTSFPFDLELAIDDWIFMIFFVGNDFLPHLPSLEIREGAIDMLLRIWKQELGRMGGYLTNHGKVNLGRAQIILEGLASNEDEIFQKRKDDRQDATQKRRRIEDHRRQDDRAAREKGQPVLSAYASVPGTMQLNGTEYVAVAATARGGSLHPSLPTRPQFDLVPKEETSGTNANKKLSKSEKEAESMKLGLANIQGSNEDIVNNRRAIRMANLDAAARLKAEMSGVPLPEAPEESTVELERTDEDEQVELPKEEAKENLEGQGEDEGVDEEIVAPELQAEDGLEKDDEVDGPSESEAPSRMSPVPTPGTKRGMKRTAMEADLGEPVEDPPNPEADQPVSKKKLNFNPDGTVDGYVDDVRLWEPGYRERYYEQKFGVAVTDTPFINEITRSYVEGLCWVLEYYYQGVPAWDWYYPYHYAPFAQDFQNVDSLEITFDPAEPFKPYGQLLGVFPAASRKHLPAPLQTLMTDDDSPIIDFYPSDFEIDMNGKKMAWQGVALLPFIDQTRLLDALASKEGELTEDEKKRNRWGDSVMLIGEGNGLYDAFCGLYGLKAATKPVPLDTTASLGVAGSALNDPACVPNSAFETPLPSVESCPDIDNNTSLSVRYYFPRQAHSHRSVLLRGFRPPATVLSESDKDWVRRGGPDVRRGGGSGGGRGRHGQGPGPQRDGAGIVNGRRNMPLQNAPGFGPGPGAGYNPPSGGYGYPAPPAPTGQGGYGGYGGGQGGGYGGGGGGYGSGQGGAYGGGGYGGYAPPPPVAAYGAYPPPPLPGRNGGNPYAPPPSNYAPPKDPYAGAAQSQSGGYGYPPAGQGGYAAPPAYGGGQGGYGGGRGGYGQDQGSYGGRGGPPPGGRYPYGGGGGSGQGRY